MGKPAILIALGILFAAVAATLTLGFLKRQTTVTAGAGTRLQTVVVASKAISRGEAIEHEAVKVIQWPASSIPNGAFEDEDEVVGKFARTTIYPDDPLTSEKLLESKAPSVLSMLVPKGWRAISVKVNEVTGISGFVTPGSHVDVVLTVPGTGTLSARARIILQDVEVLAIAQKIEQQDKKPVVVDTVTLNVTPQGAEAITLAATEGTLQLVLRNDRDQGHVASKGTTLEQVIGLKKSGASEGPSVELIRGLERTSLRF